MLSARNLTHPNLLRKKDPFVMVKFSEKITLKTKKATGGGNVCWLVAVGTGLSECGDLDMLGAQWNQELSR